MEGGWQTTRQRRSTAEVGPDIHLEAIADTGDSPPRSSTGSLSRGSAARAAALTLKAPPSVGLAERSVSAPSLPPITRAELAWAASSSGAAGSSGMRVGYTAATVTEANYRRSIARRRR